MKPDIEIVGEITEVRTSVIGHAIREIERLRKMHGPGRWRKLKGGALARLPDGAFFRDEVHRYEAHGSGKRAMKVKRIFWDE